MTRPLSTLTKEQIKDRILGCLYGSDPYSPRNAADGAYAVYYEDTLLIMHTPVLTLIGNAVGDAYGLATEFMTKKAARERYGNGPIAFGTDRG